MSAPLCFIIEDNRDASQIFAKLVAHKGFHVEEIMDGLNALTCLAEASPHLVILDIHLPQVSGVHIFEYIRSQAHLEHTAIVVVSADPAMTRIIKDDVDFVMHKPINVPQLSVIIDRVMHQLSFGVALATT